MLQSDGRERCERCRASTGLMPIGPNDPSGITGAKFSEGYPHAGREADRIWASLSVCSGCA